jgi:hypothetical protein
MGHSDHPSRTIRIGFYEDLDHSFFNRYVLGKKPLLVERLGGVRFVDAIAMSPILTGFAEFPGLQ